MGVNYGARSDEGEGGECGPKPEGSDAGRRGGGKGNGGRGEDVQNCGAGAPASYAGVACHYEIENRLAWSMEALRDHAGKGQAGRQEARPARTSD